MGENFTTAKLVDDEKMNSRFKTLLGQYKKTVDSAGSDVKDIPHGGNKGTIGSSAKYTGPMHTDLMTYTQMLEYMDAINEGIDEISDDIQNTPIETSITLHDDSEKDILEELNKIFTPVLIMQSLEKDKAKSELSESGLLTEQNVIKFDDQTRLAQLISACALLIAKSKNDEKYQMYQKAATIRNKMKLEIQKDNYDAAKALAQKYLVKVSTSNASPVARNAANELLPETNR